MAVRVGTRNVFTVDLEEWFHVCGVGGELAPEHWDRLPARVEQTTRVLLDLLDALQVRATFFVVGWVGDRYPRLIERCWRRATKSARMVITIRGPTTSALTPSDTIFGRVSAH
jgi:hypothetical protein